MHNELAVFHNFLFPSHSHFSLISQLTLAAAVKKADFLSDSWSSLAQPLADASDTKSWRQRLPFPFLSPLQSACRSPATCHAGLS